MLRLISVKFNVKSSDSQLNSRILPESVESVPDLVRVSVSYTNTIDEVARGVDVAGTTLVANPSLPSSSLTAEDSNFNVKSSDSQLNSRIMPESTVQKSSISSIVFV